MATWKLEDVKIQFSKLVHLARKRTRLVTFMRASPLADALGAGKLKLMRSRDLPRDLVL